MPVASPAAQSILEAYVAIWSEPDAARRLQLIERSLGPQAEILGPGYELRGHREIDADAARSLSQDRGARAVVSSGFDQHHDVVRFAIAIVEADGRIATEGWDIAEFGDDGRIRRVLSFWGALPPVPSGWPARLAVPAA